VLPENEIIKVLKLSLTPFASIFSSPAGGVPSGDFGDGPCFEEIGIVADFVLVELIEIFPGRQTEFGGNGAEVFVGLGGVGFHCF